MHATPVFLVDVGNTHTKIALLTVDPQKTPTAQEMTSCLACSSYTLPTQAQTTDAWGLLFMQLCAHSAIAADRLAACVIASVVPAMNTCLANAAKKYLACPALFVPDDITLPFSNAQDIPAAVGADRLVAAFGARREFSHDNLIVMDFGTATTVDCMQKNTYIPSVIAPGIRSSAHALATQTAQLPQLTLTLEDTAFTWPADTMSSLNTGFLFGFADMADGLCRRVKKLLGDSSYTIATGGLAASVAQLSTQIDCVHPDLLLSGLAMAFVEYTRQGRT